jgi:hypothetical protein
VFPYVLSNKTAFYEYFSLLVYLGGFTSETNVMNWAIFLLCFKQVYFSKRRILTHNIEALLSRSSFFCDWLETNFLFLIKVALYCLRNISRWVCRNERKVLLYSFEISENDFFLLPEILIRNKEEWLIHFLLIQIWEIEVISKLVKHRKFYNVKYSISVLCLQLPLKQITKARNLHRKETATSQQAGLYRILIPTTY